MHLGDNTFILSAFRYHCSQWWKWPSTLEHMDIDFSVGSCSDLAQWSFRLATHIDIAENFYSPNHSNYTIEWWYCPHAWQYIQITVQILLHISPFEHSSGNANKEAATFALMNCNITRWWAEIFKHYYRHWAYLYCR